MLEKRQMRACECKELCKCEMFADTERCCDCVWATKRLHSERREEADECGELQLFIFSPTDNALLMCLDGRRGRGVAGCDCSCELAAALKESSPVVFHGKNEEKTPQWRSSLSSRFVSFSSATSHKRPRLSFCRSPHKGCRCLRRIVTHCLVLKNGR